MNNLFLLTAAESPTSNVFTAEALIADIFRSAPIDLTDAQVVSSLGLIPVEAPLTAHSEGTVLIATNNNGSWKSDWVSVNDYQTILTNRQVESSVRNQRNFLLSKTDWTQGKDVPDAVSSKYTAYRRALRDITEQPGFPTTIAWPAFPN